MIYLEKKMKFHNHLIISKEVNDYLISRLSNTFKLYANIFVQFNMQGNIIFSVFFHQIFQYFCILISREKYRVWPLSIFELLEFRNLTIGVCACLCKVIVCV